MNDRLDDLINRMQFGKPLYPWPEADQDTSFVAFVLHRQGERVAQLEAALAAVKADNLRAFKLLEDASDLLAVPTLEDLEALATLAEIERGK